MGSSLSNGNSVEKEMEEKGTFKMKKKTYKKLCAVKATTHWSSKPITAAFQFQAAESSAYRVLTAERIHTVQLYRAPMRVAGSVPWVQIPAGKGHEFACSPSVQYFFPGVPVFSQSA